MNQKKREVRYERLRPSKIREAREACPVVYIPLGTLEWHGLHDPVGFVQYPANVGILGALAVLHLHPFFGGFVRYGIDGDARRHAVQVNAAKDGDHIIQAEGW